MTSYTLRQDKQCTDSGRLAKMITQTDSSEVRATTHNTHNRYSTNQATITVLEETNRIFMSINGDYVSVKAHYSRQENRQTPSQAREVSH